MYVGENWDEFNSEICPRHWKKQRLPKGYKMNGEYIMIYYIHDYTNNNVPDEWGAERRCSLDAGMPILREWVDDDFPLRARGELSQKPTEEGWWQEGLVTNFMVHYAWMLHYG